MATTYDAIANLAQTMGSSLSTTNSAVSAISSSLSTTNSAVSDISSGLSNMSTNPLVISPFTLASLPDVAANVNKIILVTDAAGGSKICQSNGANWVLINTSTVVS